MSQESNAFLIGVAVIAALFVVMVIWDRIKKKSKK